MKAVIFDLGNVLVHYDHASMLAAVGQLTDTPERPLTLPPDVIRQFVTGRMNGRSFHQFLRTHTGVLVDYDTFTAVFNATQRRNNDAIAYAVELQQRSDITVGIISNTNAVHAAWLHRHIPELALFNPVVMSNEVGLLKPDAAIYHHALQQMGIPAHQAGFIDDTAANITGAAQVGIYGILHTSLPTTQTTLETWLSDS
ncbi:MAG: HAD family hydrolase [Anaerolineae bacterium]